MKNKRTFKIIDFLGSRYKQKQKSDYLGAKITSIRHEFKVIN